VETMPTPTTSGVIRAAGSRTRSTIFIRWKDLRSALGAKAVNWGVDSDHRANVMRFRILRTIVRLPAPRVKVDREKLQNKDTAGALRAATGSVAPEQGQDGGFSVYVLSGLCTE
jgi:hypothetical protein